MLPVVLIDVVPADVPAEHSTHMVEACSQALASGDCALSSSAPESTRPESVALVVWQNGQFLQVNVRVGRRDGEWVTRQLEFSQEDSLPDRFTTVGLTVATLVDAIQPSAAPQEPAREAPRAAEKPAAALPQKSVVIPKARPSQPENREPFEISAAIGGLLAPGWNDGGWQRGAWASLSANWPGTILFGSAYGSYAQSNGPDVEAGGQETEWQTQWLTLALGVGVRKVVQPLNLRLQIAAELAFRHASATVEGAPDASQDSHFYPRLHGLVVWPARGRVGMVIGGNLGIPPVYETEQKNPVKVQGPSFAGEVLAGIEVRF